ncbi:hypothetical protein ACHQM5_005960 [Ranunculus cassubicifolius]
MAAALFCFLSNYSKPRRANIFDPQGQLQRLELPITAAELMLEAPGSIVCCVNELQKTRGIWGLRADENLMAGKFYIMFPAKRVYGKLSQLELGIIEDACKNKGKRIGPKVFAEEEEGKAELRMGNDQYVSTGYPNCKLGSCKQWRPILEPIIELS